MDLPLPILSQLAVKIEVKNKKFHGSGFLVTTPAENPYLYVVTAKHCLFGKDFKYKPKESNVTVHFNNGAEPPVFTSYTLGTTDKLITDPANNPDLAALQISKTSVGLGWDFPESFLADYDPKEIELIFKGYPEFTSGKEGRTIHLKVISTDSSPSLIRAETGTGFRAESSTAEYNVEGFSGSGLCVAINERYYLIGIVYEYEAASNRFHSVGIKTWLTKQLLQASWFDIASERLLPFQKFRQNVADATDLLGPRYSIDFTFPVPLLEVLPALSASPATQRKLQESFAKVLKAFEDFQANYRSLDMPSRKLIDLWKLKKKDYGYIQKDIDLNSQVMNHRELLRELSDLINNRPFPETDFKGLRKLSRAAYESGYTLSIAVYNLQTNYPPYETILLPYQRAASTLGNESEIFLGATQSTDFELLEKPILRLGGKAGSGKSHLLADIANSRINDGLPTLLFLGQNFLKDEDPWKTILSTLDLPDVGDDLLTLLNEKGRISGQRIFIFIDAINEGLGLRIWKKYMTPFINRFEHFPYVALVLSFRDSYEDILFPNSVVNKRFVSLYHNGFTGFEVEAFVAFAKEYGLEKASIPVLTSEFSNPLFLRLLCVGLKTDPNYNPSVKIGIERVFGYYVKDVNQRLAIKEKYDFDDLRLNLVQMIINDFTNRYVAGDLQPIPYVEAILLVEDVVRPFIAKRRMLEDLLHENIFIDQVEFNDDTDNQFYVEYAYQRFGDLMVARKLIEMIGADYKAAFSPTGVVTGFFKRTDSELQLQGLLEALAILWPAAFGDELHLSVPDKNRFSKPFMMAFLDSLAWRRSQPHPQVMSALLEDFLYSNDSKQNLAYFWKTILESSLYPANDFNGEYLHQILLPMTMADRDAGWTTYLHRQYPAEEWNPTPVTRLLRWAWNSGPDKYYDPEVVNLGATTLAWFLTSTNRGLRDVTTKALIHLFEYFPDLLLIWLKKFSGVNDPYIVQRIYAIAFGAAVRWQKLTYLGELADFISNEFFSEMEVYPDILARDYARQIVEYAAVKGVVPPEKLPRVQPPYGSNLPDVLPAPESLLQYRSEGNFSKETKYQRGADMILASMVVDHGMGSRYGDFGRYVFQSALRDWKVNSAGMSNLAVQWIMEKYGYDPKKVGLFDTGSQSNSERIRHVHLERIGKKYQWIAFYEILARVADSKLFYPNDWNQREQPQRYEGPWEPYVRDIDPTFVNNPLHSKKISAFSLPPYDGLNLSNEQWIKETNDIISPELFAIAKDNFHEEWVILEIHPEYGDAFENDTIFEKERKRLWLQLRSYLVKNRNYKKLTGQLTNADFMNRWMPEYRSDYKLFNREYYWSPANKSLRKDREVWLDVEYKEAIIGQVAPTAQEYLWEEEFDNSKPEGAVAIIKPSQFLYELLQLSDGPNDGEFIDDTGKVVCFDPSVNYITPSCLLVNKQLLYSKLSANKLNIFWTILGEKQVLNSDLPSIHFSALIKRSGEKIQGEYSFPGRGL